MILTRIMSLVVTAGALAVAAAHVAFPDLNIDTVTLALIGIAILPWAGHVLESLELPGGYKARFRALEQRVERQDERLSDSAERVEKANQAAIEAVGQAAAAEQKAEVASTIVLGAAPSGHDQSLLSTEQGLQALIGEYDEIRRDHPDSHEERTSAMTAVVVKMIRLLQSVGPGLARDGLFAAGGKRLAAYVDLYVHPDPMEADKLVQSLSETEPGRDTWFRANPFEQWWGIRALDKVLEQMESRGLRRDLVEVLATLESNLQPGTDRAFEMARLLRRTSHPTRLARQPVTGDRSVC